MWFSSQFQSLQGTMAYKSASIADAAGYADHPAMPEVSWRLRDDSARSGWAGRRD
jgi:hypothetical protein